MDMRQRLDLFYSRLKELPPFSSHDQALAEIIRILDEVEDEHSGVLRDPSGMPNRSDGRMYPPHPAFARECDVPDVVLYRQAGHATYIGAGGAVLILNVRSGATELDKPGGDGRRIQL